MKNQEQYKQLIRTIFCIILLAISAALFWFVWLHIYSPMMDKPYWRKGHWFILFIYLICMFALVKVYGGWRIGYLKCFNIIYSQIAGIIMTNTVMYFLFIMLTKHLVNPSVLMIMTLIQFIAAIFWGIVCTKIYLYTYPPINVVLIYGERPALGLMKKIQTREERFTIGEMLHISAGVEVIEQRIKNYQGVVICDIPSEARNRILKYCYCEGVRSYTTPKISDLLIRSAEKQHMFDTPLLLSRNNGLTIEQQSLKRAMDIVISTLALIIASPIMGIISICIKLEDGGSVIYRQKRLTLEGKEFYIYKFRSMKENAEQDGIARLAKKKDARITRMGKVIRPIRFDELPQLYNILRGDMSLVGPRPERPEITKKYMKEIPEFSYRLKVKAGLTGYAQVYGRYNTMPYDKLKLDLMYIQDYSLRLDFEILFKTVQILFMKESTEGM